MNDIREYPTKILYPTDSLPYDDEPIQAFYEEFMQKLGRFFGAKPEVFSIAERWDQRRPSEANRKGLKGYQEKQACVLSIITSATTTRVLNRIIEESLIARPTLARICYRSGKCARSRFFDTFLGLTRNRNTGKDVTLE